MRKLYLRDRSSKTIMRAAILTYKLHIKLATSSNHGALTSGLPVLELALQRQAPGKTATNVAG